MQPTKLEAPSVETSVVKHTVKVEKKGKDLSHLMMYKSKSQVKMDLEPHLQSNILVKLLNHKALMFDIQSTTPKLTSQKMPDYITAATTIVLTSSEQMVLLGGQERGIFKGQCTIYNIARLDYSQG